MVAISSTLFADLAKLIDGTSGSVFNAAEAAKNILAWAGKIGKSNVKAKS
jgi:hypothetical protein